MDDWGRVRALVKNATEYSTQSTNHSLRRLAMIGIGRALRITALYMFDLRSVVKNVAGGLFRFLLGFPSARLDWIWNPTSWKFGSLRPTIYSW